jgi:magnesium chelatase accessory protein
MERAKLSQRLDWETDGRDWPNRAHSHFVKAAGLTWHVQEFGSTASNKPKILLLHGTGSSSHSWRDVTPLLALRYQVVAIDLPGHAFTSMPPAVEQSLSGMSRNVAELLRVMSFTPTLVIGHSAGAAVAARMVLDGAVAPVAVVSLNGAFLGFGGLAGQLFSPIARLLSAGSFAARFFAWQATDYSVVEKLVRGTGSVLDPLGMKLYAQLVRNPIHVSAALAMMANWNLDALERDIPQLTLPVWLVSAENDLTVPPSQATQVARLLPNARQVVWPMLGHLAHEESPMQCVRLIDEVMQS